MTNVMNFEQQLAQRKSEAESKACEYFYNTKQRQAYYWGSGSMFDDLECYNEAFMPFTDDEVSRIKFLIIDDVNNSEITPSHPSFTPTAKWKQFHPQPTVEDESGINPQAE